VSWLGGALRKIVGLFVDDPTLAGGIALWIVVIALLGFASPALGLLRAFALALGLCAILTLSIVRGAAPPG